MCKQKIRASLRCFVRAFNGTTVDNHHLIDPGFGLAAAGFAVPVGFVCAAMPTPNPASDNSTTARVAIECRARGFIGASTPAAIGRGWPILIDHDPRVAVAASRYLA